MKLKFSPKSAKVSILAAMTIATSIASTITPSLAEQPSSFLRPSSAPNTSYFFFGKSNVAFTVRDNCNEVSKLFGNTPFQSSQPFLLPPGRQVGELTCNGQVPGYTSPAFGSNAGVIQVLGDSYFIKSNAFFKAMKITPTKLTEQQGKDFIAQNPRINTNLVLEEGPPPPPAPPALPPARLPMVLPVPPDRIISYPGLPDLAIFNNSSESFPIGCPAVRNLWSGIRTERATAQEHQNMLTYRPTKFGHTTRAGDLYCNSPTQIQGYVSPVFNQHPFKYAGAILVNGKTYMIDNYRFFQAMGITPVKLDDKQVREFLNKSTFGATNLTSKI